jgi:hypothetical protein
MHNLSFAFFLYLAGSVSTLNTIRKDKQYMQSQSTSGVPDYDPFTLRNSTKEFRTRCDKVFQFEIK